MQVWSLSKSKRVVIAHGWADDPTKGWLGWIQGELSKEGIKASAPQFPNPKTPETPDWMQTFRAAIGEPDDELVLVGHSLGCLVVLRYLSDLDPSVRVAGIVLVAGMADIPQWHPNELFEPPLDFKKIQQIAKKRICIYSDDDDKVLPERSKELAKLIDAELVLDAGKGHFAGYFGCSELPSALEAVKSCFSQ